MIMNNNYDFILTSNDYHIITSTDSNILEYPKLFNTTCIRNWCSKFNYQFNQILEILHKYYSKQSSSSLHFTEYGKIMKQ